MTIYPNYLNHRPAPIIIPTQQDIEFGVVNETSYNNYVGIPFQEKEAIAECHADSDNKQECPKNAVYSPSVERSERQHMEMNPDYETEPCGGLCVIL